MKKKYRVDNVYSFYFALPAAILFFVFFLLPTLLTFVFAFTDWSIYYLNDIHFNGLENFKQIAQEEVTIRSFINSLVFAIATVVGKNVLGLALALLVNRKMRSRGYLRSVFFFPHILSVLTVSVVFSAILNPTQGILNEFLRGIGLDFLAKSWLTDAKYAMMSVCAVSIWQGVGFHMLIFLSGLQSVEKVLYESARIDGANSWKQLTSITIPMIMPSITVNATLSMVTGLKVFAQVYSLTNGGPGDATTVVALLIYKAFGAGTLGYASAISLIFTIVIATLSILFMRIFKKREVEL